MDVEEKKVEKLWEKVSPKQSQTQPSRAISPVLHLYILQQESEYYDAKFALVDP